MQNMLTEIVFILDRSGSMAGMESDAIGGFNAMLQKQKKEPGQALISTVLFDDKLEMIHDRVPLDQMKPMTENDYCVGGCTALLDAVGWAIKHIANVHKYARAEDRPGKTLFVITTDGMENASHQYDYKQVKELIGCQKEKFDWEFLFLGANIDAAKEAARFGIGADCAADYHCDTQGTRLNYEAVSDAICAVRACKGVPKGWKKRIDADYQNRK